MNWGAATQRLGAVAPRDPHSRDVLLVLEAQLLVDDLQVAHWVHVALHVRHVLVLERACNQQTTGSFTTTPIPHRARKQHAGRNMGVSSIVCFCCCSTCVCVNNPSDNGFHGITLRGALHHASGVDQRCQLRTFLTIQQQNDQLCTKFGPKESLLMGS